MNILDEINCQITDTVIYETKDFSKFTFEKTNRAVDPAHVQEIKESIREKGFLTQPILVGSNGVIKEGQHRYTACKELDHPILFIIDDEITMDDIQTMNSTHENWKTLTYVKHHAADNIASYIYIMKLFNRFNTTLQHSEVFNLNHIFMALFNKEKLKPEKKVAAGLLSVTEQMYETAYKKLEWVESIINYYRDQNLKFKGSVSSMIFALIWCYGYVKIPNDRVYEIIVHNFQESQDWSRTESCLNEINRIYRRKYGPRNWIDLSGVYEKDPKRKQAVPFYERKDQQPMKGDK